MCVNIIKHQSSVIKIKMLQNIYTFIQISNYKHLYLLYWLGGKSANDKVKVVNSCVKNNMDSKNVYQK